MAGSSKSSVKVNKCPRCGRVINNFCTYCDKPQEVNVDELMDLFGLTPEVLMSELADEVLDRKNWPALSKALDMRRMGPVKRVEHSGDLKNPVSITMDFSAADEDE